MSELLGGGRTHEQTSLSQSAIGSNITVDAGSVSGSYSRDPGSANGHLANAFDPTALSNALQAQQLGGQLVGEVGGQVSDVLKSSNPAFAEGGAGRVGLETAGNAIVAAVTGGNVGAVALGTAAGGLASAATRDWAQSVASGLTTDPATRAAVANVLSNGVASVAGAAGGLLGGAGKGNASVNALNGAAAASAVQQFNQAEDNAKTGKSDLPEGYEGYGVPDDRGGPVHSDSFVGLISYTRLSLCRHSDGAAVGHLVRG
ncbi:hypothetical protein [Gluconacetobacter asukensis]|uniref:Uncharacterized protein n=1 Tax=Gluconacetobacter asukensis TaxID=1017181 RepID=A0A7W4P1D0_9PROT|nr:hypothetical protein [Gluconacetobacter asukensis]MBB2173832.1 hypothetical protein [Gluconacetobacter asukensis]